MNKLFSTIIVFLINLTAFFCLLPSIALSLDEDTASKLINIATIDYPPLMGEQEGLMTDIVKEAFSIQEYQVNYTLIPMARIAWSITEGDSDAAIGSIHWLRGKQLLEQVRHKTIYYTGMHLFYRKQQFPEGINYQDLSEINQYKIGYIRSGSMLQVLKKAGIKPQLVKDLATNSRKLKTQRIDMFVATELGGWGAIKKKYPDAVNEFAMMPRPILDILGSGDVIFPLKNKHIQGIFERGLLKLINNGGYRQILEKYYGKGKIPTNLLPLIL